MAPRLTAQAQPTRSCAACDQLKSHAVAHIWPLAQRSVNAAIQLPGKFEWSSNRCSTKNSTNMATPIDQDNPVGSSVAPSDMPSMSDILHTHKTTSSWKLFVDNHFAALCHEKGCTLCATYMLHLTQEANAGELGPRPEGLEHALSCIITASILHFKEHTTHCLRLSTATGA